MKHRQPSLPINDGTLTDPSPQQATVSLLGLHVASIVPRPWWQLIVPNICQSCLLIYAISQYLRLDIALHVLLALLDAHICSWYLFNFSYGPFVASYILLRCNLVPTLSYHDHKCSIITTRHYYYDMIGTRTDILGPSTSCPSITCDIVTFI